MRLLVQYLTRNRHGTFSYRRELPEHLRPAFGGKRNIIVSLATKNREDALRGYSAVHNRTEAQITAALKGGVIVTPTEAEEVAQRWLANALARDKAERHDHDYRTDNRAQVTSEMRESHYSMAVAQIAEQLEWGDVGIVAQETEEALALSGTPLPRNSRSWLRVAEAVGRAKLQLLKAQQARGLNDWSKEPEIRVSTAPRLLELHKRWAKGKKNLKSVGEAKGAIEKFISLVGDHPADRITRRHIIEFRDSKSDAGMKAATQEKKIRLIQAILQRAMDDDLIKGPNPAQRVKFNETEAAHEKRHPFTLAQLQLIFSDPIFTQCQLPKTPKAGGAAAFWLPLMFLFSGIRPNELAQLCAEDFIEENGVWAIWIRRQVKAAASNRKVPVHAALIEMGLKEYISGFEAGPVFPMMKPNKYGNRAQNFSDWYSPFLRGKGITDEKTTFYSFRHTFVEAATAAQVPDAILQRLIGHAARDVLNQNYRKAFPLVVLKAELDKVKYPGLDLSGVKWRKELAT